MTLVPVRMMTEGLASARREVLRLRWSMIGGLVICLAFWTALLLAVKRLT
jgi:hypothetical protein